MKKILAMAAVAALAAGASVYAANPFSDVSTSDWAYQAVADLSDQGVVEGYPDGTFKGENNITRYEMAQIIARLMAKEDQLNAEQRATVDKLAGEYADELDNLGVRVSNLEKKVGNIAWSGDARMRYQHSENTAVADGYTGRIRINAKATVNDSTYVFGRLTTGNVDLQNSDGAEVVKMDRIYAHHDFGVAGVTLGRYDVAFGQQVSWLYGNAVDGAEAQFKLGDVNLKAGFGQLTDGPTTALKDTDAFYAKAGADLGFATLGVDYFKTTGVAVNPHELLGVNVKVPVGDFRVFGDYYKDTDAANDPQIWTAGLGYGALDLKKAGSFALDVAYFDVESGLYEDGMTGVQFKDATKFFSTDGNFFLATGDVTLAQNTFLHAEYAFGSDADNGAKDVDDSYTVSLNYKF